MRWWVLTSVAAAAALCLAPRNASAEASSDQTCARLEKLGRDAERITDQAYLSTLTYREKGRVAKAFKMRIISRGLSKALVSFLEPGEMRGTRILIADAETMYVYIPDFRRVRRIAGHALRQSFLGTNIYYEDIAERQYAARWDCSLAKTTPEDWVLDLHPKAGIQTAYSKLRLTIGQKTNRLKQIDYFEGDREVRSQLRDNWQTKEGLELASRMRYVSHDRDAELTLEITDWQTNTGLPESAFTRRSLLEGF
jgi:outer membrane lipoprotein-sorting protein